MTTVVDTAVVPLAGLATRIQPLARAFPKEMLPLGDRPVLHHVIDELASAGVRHVVLVLGPGGETVKRYFDRIPELDAKLESGGRGRDGDPVWKPLADVRLSYVTQEKPAGVANAVSLARPIIGDRPCVVHMGDSVVWPKSTMVSRMIQAFEETRADMVVAVGRSLIHPSGATAVAEPIDGSMPADRPFRLRRLLEQQPSDGPTLPFVVGRFLLKGPLSEWDGMAPGFGRLGGMAPLLNDPDAAQLVGVSFSPHERLLGSGTTAEYHASWRHVLDGGQA